MDTPRLRGVNPPASWQALLTQNHVAQVLGPTPTAALDSRWLVHPRRAQPLPAAIGHRAHQAGQTVDEKELPELS